MGGLRPIHAGLIFFGWGGLLTALAGVFVAPALAKSVGEKAGVLVAIFAYGSIMVLAGVGTVSDQVWLIGSQSFSPASRRVC